MSYKRTIFNYKSKQTKFMQNQGLIIGLVVAVLLIGVVAVYSNSGDEAKDTMTQNQVTAPVAQQENQNNMDQEEMGVEVGGAMMLPSKDIVENAMEADNVTTVVAAIAAAGLVDTLKGPGPFTVFAPNNAAFEKLPAGTVETLLKPESKAMLTSILTYHVVPGIYTSTSLRDGQVLTTVNGQDLTITKQGNQITVNGSAMVETADVISSNGVTFVIDSVLMPEAE